MKFTHFHVGFKNYGLETHFGTIELMLELTDSDHNDPQSTTLTFQTFDTNFLMGTFLRLFFEHMHSSTDSDLSNTNSSLRNLAKLVENRLPGRFQQFRLLLEKHFCLCQQMKKMDKVISIDEKLYKDISGL